jgi:tRNA (cytidine/uridine-2'-O-)-methyltransferase
MPITPCVPFAPISDPSCNARDRSAVGTGDVAATSGLQVVLYQPEIPQNTGNVARTCAATRTPLHLIEPLGFRVSDRYLKRAGLDYWPQVSCQIHKDFSSFCNTLLPTRLILFSARAARCYFDFHFSTGDCLVFGAETRGLPEELLALDAGSVLHIPIDRSRVRSLNLATTVGAALFEALRQLAARQDGVSFHPTGEMHQTTESGGSATTIQFDHYP